MLGMQGCSSGVEELSSGEAQFEAGSLHLALLLFKFLTSRSFSSVLIETCEWLGGALSSCFRVLTGGHNV